MIEYKQDGIVGYIYAKEDFEYLKDIYNDWKNINKKIKKIKDITREVNLPEVVSE